MYSISESTTMEGSEFCVRFILATLATWRLTHLIVNEDGPLKLIERLRESLADTILASVVGCFGCLSVCIAIPFAFFVCAKPVELLVTSLALSGAAFLLERVSSGAVIVERLPDESSGDP